MTSNTTGDKEVRQRLIDGGYVDCVVQLPEKLFLTTGIPCCLFFFSKNRDGQRGFRKRRGEILFIDARQKGAMVSRKQRVLTDEDVEDIAKAYHAYRTIDGDYQDIQGFCKTAHMDEVEANDYKLACGPYVGTEDEMEDANALTFEEKVAELTEKLRRQFHKSNDLQERILRNLEGLL